LLRRSAPRNDSPIYMSLRGAERRSNLKTAIIYLKVYRNIKRRIGDEQGKYDSHRMGRKKYNAI